MESPSHTALTFVDRLASGNGDKVLEMIHPSASRSEVMVALRDRVRKLSINWGALKSRHVRFCLPVLASSELRTGGMLRTLRRLTQDQAFADFLSTTPRESYQCVFVTCEFAHAHATGFILVVEDRVGWCTLNANPVKPPSTQAPELPGPDRSGALLNLLRQGDTDAFAAQLPAPFGTLFGGPGMAAMWKMFQESFGAFQAFETAPQPKPDTTLTRIRFEKASLNCRLEWNGARLTSVIFE